MKKFLTMALCVAAVGTMSAQKATVDQAKKLSGKIDKVEEALSLIKQAAANPETSNDAYTYYVGGKIGFDAFEEATKKRAINPQDPAVNLYDMGNELVDGYNWFLKALPLDSVPNEKGQVKPKYSKEMVGKMNAHHNDYFSFGGEMYNNKKFYPEAYNSFMIYGDMAAQPWASKEVLAVPDTTLALAYYYAGIAAFSGNELQDALKAFGKARAKGITDSQSYVYEIACWQNIMQRDSTLEAKGKAAIENIARTGYQNFGISNPLFINNLTQALVDDNRSPEAISIISKQIESTPDQAFLYGLRAWVNDHNGNHEEAIKDYRSVAALPNADAENLVRAAKRIYQQGQVLYDKIDTYEPAQRKEVRNDVKQNYWQVAKDIANRALEQDPGNPGAEQVVESVDYMLSL